MPFSLKLSLGIYITASILGLIAAIVALWPGAADGPIEVTPEAQYLLCAAAAGALGSYIHLATSFIEHAGRGRLTASWSWWYFLRPWIGSALALVVYFVVRAGLIAGPADTTAAVNPYGVAALAALSGMFSHQATAKLRNLFENICAVDRVAAKPDEGGG
jgi:hypothetical protein